MWEVIKTQGTQKTRLFLNLLLTAQGTCSVFILEYLDSTKIIFMHMRACDGVSDYVHGELWSPHLLPVYATACMWRSDANLRKLVSFPFTLWILGMDFVRSALAASAFTR